MKNKKMIQMPELRFSPTAWAKLFFMRDMTDNEVGGFGVTSADDLLFVKDFVIVKQKVTSVSVVFDDEAVADYFEDQVEAGRGPEQFARIWLHSHPGQSPQPSTTDEETFHRVFGRCEWALMFIIAQDGNTYARLQYNVGPGGQVCVPVSVDYREPFNGSDVEAWKKEYELLVSEEVLFLPPSVRKRDASVTTKPYDDNAFYQGGLLSSDELIEELEMMHPVERRAFMEELAVRCEFWDDCESEVIYE